MIDVRPAIRSDLRALREIAIETFNEAFLKDNTPENMEAYISSAFNLDQLEKEFNEAGSQFYVAWDAEEMAGYSRLRPSTEAESHLGKSAIELQRIYVHPKHQGKRIGALLMKKSIDFAIVNQYEWLWLGVWERNYRALDFYTKFGFEKFASHVFQMGDDAQTDWLMRKRTMVK